MQTRVAGIQGDHDVVGQPITDLREHSLGFQRHVVGQAFAFTLVIERFAIGPRLLGPIEPRSVGQSLIFSRAPKRLRGFARPCLDAYVNVVITSNRTRFDVDMNDLGGRIEVVMIE